MENTLTAIELTGTVDEHRHLKVEDQLPISGPKRVRVIVLYPPVDDWDENEWLQSVTRNPAFSFLKDPQEDIYSSSDGKPFNDEK